MRKLRLEFPGMVLVAVVLAGCNGIGSDSGSSGSTTTNQSPVGVWSGMDSITGLSVTALISSSGQAVFLRSDGVQFDGTAQVTGSSLAVAVDGYASFPTTFSDGSSSGVGTLSGTVSAGSSMTVSLSFTTSGNTALAGNWTLTFSSLTGTGSSLGAVTATYTDVTTGATVAIDGLGNINSQDPSTGCVLSGTISTSDTAYDIYQIDFTYKSCTGSYAVLNAVELSGLAVLNTNVSPVQLVIAVAGQASGGSYGITTALTAT
jgi:hypothetical protein